jgi:hypothetical protein
MAGLSCFSGLVFGSAARLVWILGSSRTAEGKKALEASHFLVQTPAKIWVK